MLPVLLLVGVATLLLYVYLTWNHSYWSQQNVPCVQPTSLLFGNVKSLVFKRKNFATLYGEMYKQYKTSPLVGFFKLRQPALMIRDPELVKTVLMKEFNSFHDTDLDMSKHVDPVIAENPFIINGPRWKIVRSALSPSFSGAKLKSSLPNILQACKDLIKHLESKSGEEIEVSELAMRFTTDSVFSAGFGIQSKALLDPQSKLWKMVSGSFGHQFVNGIIASFIMPAIAFIFQIRMFTKEFNAFLMEILKQSAEHREQSNMKRTDYLQALIEIKNNSEKSDNKLNINSFEDINVYANVLYLDGVGTTASPLAFTLYELALNPAIQQRLRDEINSSLDSLNDLLIWDKINNLIYLDMVVSESLRKYPPLVALTRRCTKPIKLPISGEKYCAVQPGMLVGIPIYSIHYDPEYYPDPNTFEPERFSDDSSAARHKFTYLPFGEGPRMCMGMRFALLQIKAALIAIVRNFELVCTEHTQRCMEIDQSNLLFLTMLDHQVWLRFDEIAQVN